MRRETTKGGLSITSLAAVQCLSTESETCRREIARSHANERQEAQKGVGLEFERLPAGATRSPMK